MWVPGRNRERGRDPVVLTPCGETNRRGKKKKKVYACPVFLSILFISYSSRVVHCLLPSFCLFAPLCRSRDHHQPHRTLGFCTSILYIYIYIYIIILSWIYMLVRSYDLLSIMLLLIACSGVHYRRDRNFLPTVLFVIELLFIFSFFFFLLLFTLPGGWGYLSIALKCVGMKLNWFD